MNILEILEDSRLGLSPDSTFEQIKLQFTSYLHLLVKWNKKINLIVGPEGDFSENEKKIINEKNFIKVNLGRTILRTETAIVSLISIINELLINND